MGYIFWEIFAAALAYSVLPLPGFLRRFPLQFQALGEVPLAVRLFTYTILLCNGTIASR